MRRDLARLTERTHDLLVVGGGIYGLFAAWDAALRGLSVALVERGDFGHATSYNTLRVIHGGLRYLQHGHTGRMRQSIHERTVMLRIAPHLVRPLPFLIPTYGYGMRGKAALSLAVMAHDLAGLGRNRVGGQYRRLPRGRSMSREECLRLFPGLDRRGLTGAAVYFDAQVHSSERLVVAVMRSAVEAGAVAVNYVEVTGLLTQGRRVTGVKARDVLSGGSMEISARVALNCTGPWADSIPAMLDGRRPVRRMRLSKAFNLLARRPITERYALGVYSKGHPGGDAARKRPRVFFITPRHGGALIGTEHLPYEGDPDGFEVTEEEVQTFIDDLNGAYPPAGLRREDVCVVYAGLLPVKESCKDGVSLARHYRVRDHLREDGVEGLVSVTGVKFTEARHVAERSVDLVFRKLGRTPPMCVTDREPVHGGDIDQMSPPSLGSTGSMATGLSREEAQHLVLRYGSAYTEVIGCLGGKPESMNGVTGIPRLLEAEVVHAVRRELAQRLSDVVFRRTALGMFGDPGAQAIEACAAIMARELGWSEARTGQEIEDVKATLRRHAGTHRTGWAYERTADSRGRAPTAFKE